MGHIVIGYLDRTLHSLYIQAGRNHVDQSVTRVGQGILTKEMHNRGLILLWDYGNPRAANSICSDEIDEVNV